MLVRSHAERAAGDQNHAGVARLSVSDIVVELSRTQTGPPWIVIRFLLPTMGNFVSPQ
jgi:hypothetical protein